MQLFLHFTLFAIVSFAHGFFGHFGAKTPSVCSSRIELAIDNSAVIGVLGYQIEKTYLSDAANGLLSVFNQSLSYNYYYAGDDFHGVANYDELMALIQTIPQTISTPDWAGIFARMDLSFPDDDNSYINTILFIGSVPTNQDNYTAIATKLSQKGAPNRRLIGVLLNDQVTNSSVQSMINAGMVAVPWIDSDVGLTSAIRNIMACDPGATCVDQSSDCAIYAGECNTPQFHDLMCKSCQKTCNLCNACK